MERLFQALDELEDLLTGLLQICGAYLATRRAGHRAGGALETGVRARRAAQATARTATAQ